MKLADIIIPNYLAESVPNEAKMNRAKRYFIEHGGTGQANYHQP